MALRQAGRAQKDLECTMQDLPVHLAASRTVDLQSSRWFLQAVVAGKPCGPDQAITGEMRRILKEASARQDRNLEDLTTLAIDALIKRRHQQTLHQLAALQASRKR